MTTMPDDKEPEAPVTHITGDTQAGANGKTSNSSGKRAHIEVDEKTCGDSDDSKTGQEEAPEGVHYLSGVRFWLFMFNLCAVIAMSAIDMSIVATAVPRITDHFHTSAGVGWYAVAFRLCQCAFQFLYGKAYKLFSIKRVFLLANVFSMLGSVLCATAISPTMLIIGRAVAGVGTAGLSSGTLLMLVQSTPLQRRPTFMGLWGAIEGLATVSGPLIGGALTQTAGWRFCFWINVPISGITLMLTLLCFSEAAKDGDVATMTVKEKLLQLDVMSNLMLIPGLTCLFLAFSWAETTYPWSSGRVIGLIMTFAVLTAAFIYNQFRLGDAAALPIRILKRRDVATSLVFITFFNSAGNVLEYYLPIYFQAVHGYSPAKSGLLLLPYLLIATAGAVGAGIGTSACGYYAPFMIFSSVVMSIFAGLVTTLGVNTALAKIVIYTGLSGLGYGVGSIGPSTAVQAVLKNGDISLGTAALSFGSALGPAVFIAIAQVIFTNELSKNLQGLLPGAGRANIETNGLTELVSAVPPEQSHKVLVAINVSIIQAWYLVVALACATLLGSLLIKWRSIKQKPQAESQGDARDAEPTDAERGATR